MDNAAELIELIMSLANGWRTMVRTIIRVSTVSAWLNHAEIISLSELR